MWKIPDTLYCPVKTSTRGVFSESVVLKNSTASYSARLDDVNAVASSVASNVILDVDPWDLREAIAVGIES